MQKHKIFKVNSRIEITINDDENVYKSLIQDVRDDDFSIGVPLAGRVPLRLSKGDRVNASVYTGSACYKFTTEVIGSKYENNILFYILKKPENIKKFERRNFVRVEVSLPIKYEILQSDEKDNWKNITPAEKAYSIDLSGGGLQVVFSKKIEEDSFIVLTIPIKIEKMSINIKVLGKVVRSVRQEIDGAVNYQAGIKFEDITEREREMIIRYVFYIMRKTMYIRRGDD